MILVISVLALVTALVATATTLAIGNLKTVGLAGQAGRAVDAAEAGISQAIGYIRAAGTRTLRCYPTCTTYPWNPTNPVSADVAGGGHWQAYILPVSVGNGAQGDRYLIRSAGTVAGGPAMRTVETEILVTPINLPKAVVGRTINLGGTVDLQQISVFSTGCVYKRDKLTFNYAAGPDLAYGLPPAVHSAQIITDSQGSGQYCPATAKPIHGVLRPDGTSLQACNSAYPYDQDRYGGTLVGQPACASAATHPAYQPRDVDGDGTTDINGSFIRHDDALFDSFAITRPVLTETELEQLRATAQAQGNLHASSTDWPVPSASNPHAVLFFDLNGDTVNLDPLGTTMWARGRTPTESAMCPDASLLVIVMGGDAMLNGNTNLAASIYLGSPAPHGRLSKANGTANHIGMLYADTLDLTGNLSVSLDTCYLDNPPPALFTVETSNYRELDR